MFGFLAPWALLGLGLLIVPILLHLFKPRKVRQTPISSLRWLRASQHRLSRRIKWHQILLLLLRLAFVALLVLSIAKPVVSGDKGGKKSERFIFLDTSRSMGYRPSDGPSPIDKGKDMAEQLVSHVIAGDRTAVILLGSEPRAAGPLTGDASIYVPALRSARVESGSANVAAALQLVAPMVGAPREDTALELFFVTDNHVQNWPQAAIGRFVKAWPGTVRVSVIDVAAVAPENAWISDARLIGDLASPLRKIRVQAGAVGGMRRERVLQVTGLPGLPDMSERVMLASDRPVQVEFEIPPEYDLSGKVARISLQPPDALPGDDVRDLNLDSTWATKVLVIEPESTQIEELQPGFHLRTALEALSFASQGTPQIVRRPDTAILADDITAADVIFMVDVPSLSEGNLAALTARVQNGAGLVLFLGPSLDAEFYNTKLYNPLRPAASPSPVTIGDAVRLSANSDLAGVSDVRWDHPVFAELFDPVYGDFSQARYESYYRLAIGRDTQADVLASIGDGVPAIVERPLGLGKVLVFNTTANDAWSDLPRRKSFVPLIDRLLSYLTVADHRGAFTIGELVAIPLQNVRPGDQVSVEVSTPSGRMIEPVLREAAGRVLIQLHDLREVGTHVVRYDTTQGTTTFPFVLYPGVGDSLLAGAGIELHRTWWQPADVRVIRTDATDRVPGLAETRVLLEPWLLVLACLMLLAEMVLVHRLCPRMNPHVIAHSVVGRQGFFAPDGSESERTRTGR